MKFRLNVEILLVITIVVLVSFEILNLFTNDMSCSSGYEVGTIIDPSTTDDLPIFSECNGSHNLTRQFKTGNIIEYKQPGKKLFYWNLKFIREALFITMRNFASYNLQNNQPELIKE